MLWLCVHACRLMLFGYVLGFPLWFLRTVLRARGAGMQKALMVQRFGYLVSGVKRRYFWSVCPRLLLLLLSSFAVSNKSGSRFFLHARCFSRPPLNDVSA